MKPRHPWTEHDLALLAEIYPHNPTRELCGIFDRSDRSIYEKAYQLGLRKTAEFLASGKAGRLDGVRGMPTRFKPRHEPWNKGSHFVAGGRSAETRFKKGHRGGRALQKYQPIGAERISKDGYLQRKINDDMPFQRRWRGVHILLWEERHGPLPKGYAIAFKNGDKTDIRLENFECIPRRELMARNTIHNYPPEIVEVVQLRGALNRKINNRIRKETDEQRNHS